MDPPASALTLQRFHKKVNSGLHILHMIFGLDAKAGKRRPFFNEKQRCTNSGEINTGHNPKIQL